MKTQRLKKPLSILLVLLLTLGLLPLSAFPASVAGAVTVTVAAADNREGAARFMLPPAVLTVTPGTALKYGYENADENHKVGGQTHGASADEVTPLDALLAAHEYLYGKGFEPEDYLSSSSDYFTKMFGLDSDTGGFVFSVNGISPIGPLSDGYAINEQTLSDGDSVLFTRIDAFGDYSSCFEADCQSVTSGDDVTVRLLDFDFGSIMMGTPGYTPTPELVRSPVEGAQLVVIDALTGNPAAVDGAVTDENGEAILSFDTAGKYIISATGTTKNLWGGDVYFGVPYCIITVTASSETGPDPDPGSDPGSEDPAPPEQEKAQVTIEFAFFNPASGSNGGFDVLWHEITVAEGTAESFGAFNAPAGTTVGGLDHSIAAGEITPLDALISVHADKYGEQFAIGEQLRLTSTNYVTRLFGVSGDIAYVVNGVSPTGSMSDGYGANEYVLKNGDRVMFYVSGSDMYGMGDFSSYFDKIEAEVVTGEALELTLTGHEALYAMAWSNEGTPTKQYPVYTMSDVGVISVDPVTGLLGTQLLGKTDSDGKVALTFDEPGTYLISAYGEIENDEWYGMEFPILAPWCVVTVTEAPEVLYDVTVEVGPGTVGVEFFVTAGFDASGYDIPGAQLESIDNGIESNYRSYSLSLPAGTYSYRGADANGNALGGMTFTIPTANLNEQELTDTVTLRQVEIYPSNSIDGIYLTQDDYTAAVSYGDSLAVNGQAYKSGNFSRMRLLLVTGDYGIAFAIANEALESKVLPYTLNNRAIAKGTSVLTVSQELPSLFTLTVPEGAAAKVYRQVNNYNNSYYEPLRVTYNGDGTISYVYSGLSGSLIYRVSMPGKITKAGYFATTNSGYVITFGENENPKSAENTAVPATNENSTMVNINDANHLTLAPGEVFRLRGYRAAWQIVNNVTSNIMIEPDFNFDVIFESTEGMLNIAPHTERSNWADITAIKAGTALIEVSYDAIDVAGASDGRYGATDPQRKSLVVVTVGEDPADVTINLARDYKDGVWDTEFDTFYMLGSSADAPITLDMTGALVTVSNPDIAGSEHIAAEADGIYSATLYPGNNVIKVVYEGKTAYKVIRAAVVIPVITNATNGKAANDPIMAGDDITIHFGGLFMPIPKLSGIYNPAFMAPRAQVMYKTPAGVTVATTGLQYNFISENLMQLTIPADAKDEYILTGGYTPTTNMGSGPSQHRAIIDTGIGANMGASNAGLMFSLLPDISIDIFSEPDVPVTDYRYELEVEDKAYNAGGTVTVDVYLTSETMDSVRTIDLAIDFEGLLSFSGISDKLTDLHSNEISNTVRLTRSAGSVPLEDGRVLVASLKFTVVSNLADISSAKFEIAEGACAANSYTGPDQNTTAAIGEAVTIRLYNLSVTFLEDYRATPGGFKVMLLTLNGSPDENVTYKYGDKTLFWSEKYKAYAAMVSEYLTAEEILVDINADPIGAHNIVITYTGDVVLMTNMPGINAMDAQVVYDLYSGKYADGFNLVVEFERFEADVNGDGMVDLEDVWYIQAIVLGIS